VLKLVLGPKFLENKLLAEKIQEYQDGLLDEYNCFIYIPPIPSSEIDKSHPGV
jgi:hypothetical protein